MLRRRGIKGVWGRPDVPARAASVPARLLAHPIACYRRRYRATAPPAGRPAAPCRPAPAHPWGWAAADQLQDALIFEYLTIKQVGGCLGGLRADALMRPV